MLSSQLSIVEGVPREVRWAGEACRLVLLLHLLPLLFYLSPHSRVEFSVYVESRRLTNDAHQAFNGPKTTWPSATVSTVSVSAFLYLQLHLHLYLHLEIVDHIFESRSISVEYRKRMKINFRKERNTFQNLISCEYYEKLLSLNVVAIKLSFPKTGHGAANCGRFSRGMKPLALLQKQQQEQQQQQQQ